MEAGVKQIISKLDSASPADGVQKLCQAVMMATLSRANCGKLMSDSIPAIYNLIEKIPLDCTEQIMIPIVHLKFFETQKKKEPPIVESILQGGDKVDDCDDTPDDYEEDYLIVDPQS
jgi:hypothetical protein